MSHYVHDTFLSLKGTCIYIDKTWQTLTYPTKVSQLMSDRVKNPDFLSSQPVPLQIILLQSASKKGWVGDPPLPGRRKKHVPPHIDGGGG